MIMNIRNVSINKLNEIKNNGDLSNDKRSEEKCKSITINCKIF